MPISPSVHVLTDDEMRRIRHEEFQRGIERGRFEQRMDDPFPDAMQIIELGCRLYWGRNGDTTHMDSEQWRQAHLAWFEKATAFVREQQEKATTPTATERST